MENNYFKNRPSFEEYFFIIAKSVSLRSEDVFVQHGAVLIDDNNHIIGTGYNGFVSGFDFKKAGLDPFNRKARRPYMVHAEQNALLNSVKHPKNSTVYVTGEPCVQCLLSMVNFGVKKIRYIDSVGSITDNDETRIIKARIVEEANIDMKPVKYEYRRI